MFIDDSGPVREAVMPIYVRVFQPRSNAIGNNLTEPRGKDTDFRTADSIARFKQSLIRWKWIFWENNWHQWQADGFQFSKRNGRLQRDTYFVELRKNIKTVSKCTWILNSERGFSASSFVFRHCVAQFFEILSISWEFLNTDSTSSYWLKISLPFINYIIRSPDRVHSKLCTDFRRLYRLSIIKMQRKTKILALNLYVTFFSGHQLGINWASLKKNQQWTIVHIKLKHWYMCSNIFLSYRHNFNNDNYNENSIETTTYVDDSPQ